MKRFRNILLVADGKSDGETALKRAVAVAKNNKARLTVVKVVDKLPHDLQLLKTAVLEEDIQKLIIREHLKQLNDFIAPIKDDGIHVNVKVLTGTPFLEITKEVLRNKHDLVITTAEGKGGLKEMLFGATTMHLMRKCPSPIWVIKPRKTTRFSWILAAVDPAHSDSEGKALNAKILELADSIARLEGAELHVIHTWELYSEVILRSKSRLSDREVDNVVRETEKKHRYLLEELLDEHTPKIPKKQVHFLRGDAGELIPGIAKKKRIELIVMGTVGRTGINGLLIGNTAEEILQKVNCSVLTVKPDNYVSPIKID
jgi:universal stress protein E